MCADRLLVMGDDRSAGAHIARDWIGGQRWQGWRLEVVTATRPPAGDREHPSPLAVPAESDHPSTSALDQAQLSSVTYREIPGDPRSILLEQHADLLVIGPRGHGRLKALHLGSTAEYMLSGCHTPVVMAKRAGPVRTVLVCTDASGDALSAADSAARLPWLAEATVRVVTVDTGRFDPQEALASVAARFEGIEVQRVVLSADGGVTSALEAAIEEQQADLVVLGARGRSGLRHLLVGSTTAAIARDTGCSLLVRRQDPPATGAGG